MQRPQRNPLARKHTATRPFTTITDGKKTTWSQGSIVIPVTTQDAITPQALRVQLKTLAETLPLPIHAACAAQQRTPVPTFYFYIFVGGGGRSTRAASLDGGVVG